MTRTTSVRYSSLGLTIRRCATLVIGVKRDTVLLRRVAAAAVDEVTVLDISLDQNRDDLERLLDAGASARYFEHHYAGEVPRHPQSEAHIKEAPEVCTSTLVDRHLAGRHRSWAIVAALGDNLPEVATALANVSSMAPSTTTALERLGISLDWNAYGTTIGDLCFDPAGLAQHMLPFADPIEFSRHSPAYAQFVARYEEDMQRARTLKPSRQVPGATVSVYPFRLTPPKLGGTDIAHADPLTLVAGLGHFGLGNVDFHLLGALLLGSIPGIILGSRMSTTASRVYVRNAIAVMLAVVGAKLLVQI